MPSVLEVVRAQEERPELYLAFKIVFGGAVAFLLIEFAICVGLKSHVLLNTPGELFKTCGYETLGTYAFSTVICACVGGAICPFMCPCPEEDRSGGRLDWPTFLKYFLAQVAFGTLAVYWFAVFLLTIITWSSAEDVEELLFFYSDFYGSLSFGNCTSGENLYNLELAAGVFKAESVIVMLAFILVIPCCCFCVFCVF